MSIIISETIRNLRTAKGVSQEALAELAGVSVQAVSKWENGLSCPDISLLPVIADFFGVTIDYLLTGRGGEAVCGLPDDGKLRIVQARGSRILGQGEYSADLVINLKLPDKLLQPELSLDVWGSCSIDGDVKGNVQCGNGVNCVNVGGNVSCGDGVNCGNVGENVSCGDGVNCGNVGGNISCGDGVNCGNVGGSVSAGVDIRCGDIYGSVNECGGDITCSSVMGDAHADGDIIIRRE